jgi:hypothetical protein
MDPHPGHGPRDPTLSTPGRISGSVRRTSTMDCHWPDGLGGDVRVIGRARDLVTDEAGEGRPVDQAVLDAEIAFQDERKVAALTTSPSADGLNALLGATAGPGFRRRMAQAVPAHRESRSPLHLLLDDVPVALLIAAYAFNQAGRSSHEELGLRVIVDQCAGWAGTGTMMQSVREKGRPPRIFGPPAPLLEAADDPLAWHELPPLPAMATRRRRRLDVNRDNGFVYCHAIFRDSYMHGDGNETVVHEYELDAALDADLVVTDALATPHVLPWQECPAAAASASRIIGRRAGDLRGYVRGSLLGTSTCTHLNDLLRSLDDVMALREYL